MQSVLNGRPSGPNACADQLCGTSGKKPFYLTSTTHNGANALGACAAGFHMASLHEISDPSSVEYDTARGFNQPDSGQGPPSEALGWIRTGGPTADIDLVSYNCRAWTSSSTSGNYGSATTLP